MKILFIIFINLISLSGFGQKKPAIYNSPFDGIAYDKVLVYNFNYDSLTNEKTYTEISYGEGLSGFNYTTLLGKSAIRNVDSETLQEFIAIISDTSTYGDEYADCFEPRLGFTFFYKEKQVFTVLICFDCGFLESTMPIPAARLHYNEYESTDENGNPAVFRKYLKGFSKEGSEKMLNLCERLKMNYCNPY